MWREQTRPWHLGFATDGWGVVAVSSTLPTAACFAIMHNAQVSAGSRGSQRVARSCSSVRAHTLLLSRLISQLSVPYRSHTCKKEKKKKKKTPPGPYPQSSHLIESSEYANERIYELKGMNMMDSKDEQSHDSG